MNYKKSKAFSLLELLAVIFIGSIVVIYSTIYAKEYYEALSINEKTAIIKLDLNSAKIILEKNLPNLKNDLKYKNNTLYFKNSTLLEKVTYFSMKTLSSNLVEIKIRVDDKIEQTWNFKL